MPVIDIIMPKLGESIMEATILKWLKQPGEWLAQDETLLEIATDKVDSEVPVTTAGRLAEVLYAVNDVVPIGAVIARINTETGAETLTPRKVSPPEEELTSEVPYQPTNMDVQELRPSVSQAGMARFYSPLVLKIAQEEGIALAELEAIPGSGLDGRLSKRDILAYVQGGQRSFSNERIPQVPVVVTAPSSPKYYDQPVAAQPPQSVVTGSGIVEIIELDRMRRLISKHMVDSQHTSAHVTSFAEADVTNLVLWREKVKKDFEKRENDKITFTPLFVEAVVKCLKKHSWLNSSLEGDRLLLKKEYHIGMATALPNGNLIVPVIKNADQLNIVGLSKQVNLMANAARNNKLRPDDTQGGTFTITNIGTFGSLMGTPIISQPQVAILAIGAIKKRPVVIETAQGDSIGIRHMMYLSLSYDHRIIDGALGSIFLNSVVKELEAWDPLRGF